MCVIKIHKGGERGVCTCRFHPRHWRSTGAGPPLALVPCRTGAGGRGREGAVGWSCEQNQSPRRGEEGGGL